MANWSRTHINLIGNQAKEACAYIESLCDKDGGLDLSAVREESNDEFGYTYLDKIYFIKTFSNENTDEDSFTIMGQGRWYGPYNFIQDVVEEFNLSGTYVDMEMFADFFHKMTFKDGEVSEEIQDKYHSEVANNWVSDYSNSYLKSVVKTPLNTKG